MSGMVHANHAAECEALPSRTHNDHSLSRLHMMLAFTVLAIYPWNSLDIIEAADYFLYLPEYKVAVC